MTDHLDEAAAKAVELAVELSVPDESDDWDGTVARRLRVASHLTYLAGLIRGGAGRARPVEETRCADCEEMLHRNAEVRADRATIRAQRDELLAAAKGVLHNPHANVRLVLAEAITRIEADR
jgi:hypothetical protein